MNDSRLALVYTGVESFLELAETGDRHGTVFTSHHCTAKIGRGGGPSSMLVIGVGVALFVTG